jgi:hypothetical protein
LPPTNETAHGVTVGCSFDSNGSSRLARRLLHLLADLAHIPAKLFELPAEIRQRPAKLFLRATGLFGAALVGATVRFRSTLLRPAFPFRATFVRTTFPFRTTFSLARRRGRVRPWRTTGFFGAAITFGAALAFTGRPGRAITLARRLRSTHIPLGTTLPLGAAFSLARRRTGGAFPVAEPRLFARAIAITRSRRARAAIGRANSWTLSIARASRTGLFAITRAGRARLLAIPRSHLRTFAIARSRRTGTFSVARGPFTRTLAVARTGLFARTISFATRLRAFLAVLFIQDRVGRLQQLLGLANHPLGGLGIARLLQGFGLLKQLAGLISQEIGARLVGRAAGGIGADPQQRREGKHGQRFSHGDSFVGRGEEWLKGVR